MSNNGREVFALTGQVRKLCRSVEALLSHVDAAMKRAGYSPADNYASYASKRTLGQAEVWFPPFFFRYYGVTKRFVPFVAITVDPNFEFRGWELRFKEPLEEPLVMGGIMDFGKNSKEGKGRFEFWNCLAFGDLPLEERRHDGHWISESVSKEGGPWADYDFERAHVFAVPLTEIQNPEQVEGRITKPLLHELEELGEK